MIANDPQRSPDNSGEKRFLTIFNFSGDRLFILFVRKEDLLLAQEEDLLLAQDQDKEWSPEKSKMVKKHFFPEMLGDLWSVICYHHWYPRAALEGWEKSYFSKKVLRLKKMQNYPLSIFHASVRPESSPGADLSTFQKVPFSLISSYLGAF